MYNVISLVFVTWFEALKERGVSLYCLQKRIRCGIENQFNFTTQLPIPSYKKIFPVFHSLCSLIRSKSNIADFVAQYLSMSSGCSRIFNKKSRNVPLPLSIFYRCISVGDKQRCDEGTVL